jgi:lipopolysaccharide/colanic/teichoic acid biosynthesis glycosyltransferase
MEAKKQNASKIIDRSDLLHNVSGRYLFIKRLFDIIAALAGITLLLPIMAAAAVAIIMGSDGPVLYKQIRYGNRGKAFKLYMFCTFALEDTGMPVIGKDMGEETGIGRCIRRLKIHKLPVLFNIIKGDMSFVGPRPLPVAYLERWNERQ